MTTATENANAFDRGMEDYRAGRRVCPFTKPNKVEAWRDGWLTEKDMHGQVIAMWDQDIANSMKARPA